jgi:phosphoenolpyruvate-protein phosphotransferase (PTS system enzyme I)
LTYTLHGVAVSRGIAIGRVHIVERNQFEIAEIRLHGNEVEQEVERLLDAVALARRHLRDIRDNISGSTPADIAAFIDTHLLMLEDAALSEEPVRLIREQRCNAEWAVKLQRDKLVTVFEEIGDDYLRTRRDDVDNVVDRILRNLLRHQPLRHEMPDQRLRGMVILARDLAPSDLVLLQNHGVVGLITEFGGPTSHMSILARSLGIPGVVGLHHARRYVREDETIIVDGDDGVVIGGADARILEAYRTRQTDRRRYVAALQILKEAPSVTLDGHPIALFANVELASDFKALRDVGAHGVGLYRTEFLFLNRTRFPDEEEHFETYRQMLEALGGAPLTIRTADIGADKSLARDAASAPIGANPALGLRAVRLCLREPELFWPQLRAIIRASALGPVRMMIPMLSSIDEVMQILDIVRTIRHDFSSRGIAYDAAMPIGGMIEVPAAAICADIFAAELDFLSIGTNDLIQYAIAIDRINDEVGYLYDPLNPGVLRLISGTLDAGRSAGIPVAMCGEMAGDSRYTRLLIGLGLTEFSVHPASLLEIKHIIVNTKAAAARDVAYQFLHITNRDRRLELLEVLNGGSG